MDNRSQFHEIVSTELFSNEISNSIMKTKIGLFRAKLLDSMQLKNYKTPKFTNL
jgi:hypothetical protein